MAGGRTGILARAEDPPKVVTGFPSPGSVVPTGQKVFLENFAYGPARQEGWRAKTRGGRGGDRSGLSPRRAADWLRRGGGTWGVWLWWAVG